ncbi:MAG: hypothetical protein ACE10J_05290, partial [Thermodesulfobacteriota bacterium]
MFSLYTRHIVFMLVFLVLIFSFSCQQAKEIPKQIPKELPNPVSDFTENDRYKLGLRWYQQG